VERAGGARRWGAPVGRAGFSFADDASVLLFAR